MANTQKKLLMNRMLYTKLLVVLVIIPIALFTAPLTANNSITYAIMEWLGYFLIAIGVLGRSFCTLFIGGKKTYNLITAGPYSVVRNPLYVFSFIAIVGIGLQFGMLSLLLFMILLFYLYYSEVIAREEIGLINNFGDKYLAYKKSVPRWIPKSWKFDMPETIEASPAKVLKTMMDAYIFFLPFPVLEILGRFHASGIIPILFRLP
jgi:protein-S-isoprenylcysteine O-methyltransferase Ste14